MSKILIDEATVKLALEALEGALSDDKPYIENSKKAITALREALAEQLAHQEPLTNGEIYTAYITATNQTLRPQDERLAFGFARAIEAAHNIKENT